jgi:3-hydroxyisobutyrate dehydrogenase-like beta-hydroxyacid dehydrogenase
MAAGHRVLGYDIDGDARAQAAATGVAVQESAADIARGTRLVLLSLLTSDNRRDLLWGPQSMAAALRPGTVILDTTTGRPEDIAEDSRRLAVMDIKLVDVCMSGSSQVMQEGRAIALIGDSEKNADYGEAIGALSKAQYYFEKPGEGNRVKLIVNLVFGLNRLVLAEALGLAERAGFSLDTILEILKSGETHSVAMDTKGPKMISGIYEPAVARLGQHAKDVHLILDYARQLGASVPVTETHARIIDALVRQGLGDLDNAAIFKAYHS